MRCFKCGAEVPEGANFCIKCGESQFFSEELINRAKNGDEDAVSELYRRTYNNVYFTVKALIKSEDTVLDIVQDSYVKGFKNLSQLQDPDKFRAWIKRIAHNSAVDYLRKTKPVMFSTMSNEDDAAVEFEDDRVENLPEAMVDRQETTRLIKIILDSLSEEQRLVISMFYYERLSVKEIAESLGVSENTVKSRLSYGRKKVEAEVINLEKQGTKLYSLAPLPFLMLLFRNADAQAAEIPNAGVLQAVQRECSSVYTSASEYAGNQPAADAPETADASPVRTDAAAGTEYGTSNSAPVSTAYDAQVRVSPRKAAKAAAKSAAGASAKAASKGIAAKVIMGVAAAAVVVGTVAGVVAVTQKDKPQDTSEPVVSAEYSEPASSQEPIQEPSPSPAQQENIMSPETVYAPILEEYSILLGDPDTFTTKYANPNMVEIILNTESTDNVGEYAYYDIDGNGTQELLISYGKQYKNIIDIYTVFDGSAIRLLSDCPMGERTQVSIYPDGTIILLGSGGADLHSLTVYKMEDNGRSLSSSSEMLEGDFDLQALLAEKSGNQTAVYDSTHDSIDWKPIEVSSSKSEDDILDQYLGVYMNGNDANAGTITIKKSDSGVYWFNLDELRDTGLHTLISGTVSVSGKDIIVGPNDVKFTLQDDNGFILSIAQNVLDNFETEVNPYIYEAEYYWVAPVTETNTGEDASQETAEPDFTKYDGYVCFNNDPKGLRIDPERSDRNEVARELRLYTADGNITLAQSVEVRRPVAGMKENTYIMNLDTADVSGNTYTVYDISCGAGENRVFDIYSITFTFEEDRVIMEVDGDDISFTGGPPNALLSGSYVFTE